MQYNSSLLLLFRYLNVLFVAGDNCSEVLSAAKYSVQQLPVRCEATLTNANPHVVADELFTLRTELNLATGWCLIPLPRELSYFIIMLFVLGQYQCRLAQVSSPSLTSLVSTLETHVSLRAVVPQREGQAEVESNAVTLPYVPAFHVQTSELQLTTQSTRAKLKISCTQAVFNSIRVSPHHIELSALKITLNLFCVC